MLIVIIYVYVDKKQKYLNYSVKVLLSVMNEELS